jgi:hypothetical protein
MKPELKKRWTDALRSGEYKQTDNALQDRRGFCCLGVACEVFKEDVGLKVEVPPTGIQKVALYDGETTHLPEKLTDFLGINYEGKLSNPVPRKDKQKGLDSYGTLMGANDGGYTFTEIADIIDEQF